MLLFSICGLLICIVRFSRNDAYLLSWSFISLALFLVGPHQLGHTTQLMVPAASILTAIALGYLPTVTHSMYIGGLLPTRSKWRRWRQKAASILIIFVMLTPFIPSIFFQVEQYPNFSINWEYHIQNTISVKIWWRAESEGNYDVQMELVSYLKSLDVKDGAVLLHG